MLCVKTRPVKAIRYTEQRQCERAPRRKAVCKDCSMGKGGKVEEEEDGNAG